MGAEQGKLNVPKMYLLSWITNISDSRQSCLRQSVSRINIHRSKKLNGIAKKKDDIAKHLESGNEVNAKIWVILFRKKTNKSNIVFL